METPNYGILQNAIAQRAQAQQQAHPVLQGIVGALGAYSQFQESKDKSALRKAEQEISKTKLEIAKEEQRQMPELHDMKKEQHKANLAQTAANTDASRVNAMATKQGMGTESLRQQALRNEMKEKQYESVARLTSGVLGADDARKPEAYQTGLGIAQKLGYDVSSAPKAWGPEAEIFVKSVYNSSGQALKDLQLQTEQAKLNKLQTGGASVGQSTYEKSKATAYVRHIDELAKQSDAAEDMINNSVKFLEAAKKIPTGTGPLAGVAARLSPAGQEATKYAGKLAFAEVKALGGGVVSDADLRAAERNSLSLSNSMDANKKIAEFSIATAQRKKERIAFAETLASNGIYDKAMETRLWNNYIKENPVIDHKNGNVLSGNVGNWQKYVSPEYMGQVRSKSASPENAAAPSASAGQTVQGKDGRMYRKVNGGYEAI